MSDGAKRISRRTMIKTASVAAAATVTNALAASPSPAKDTTGSSKRFEGKVALITGAAQGIGRETALQFATQGADVAICDICEQLKPIKTPMGTEAGLSETKRMVEALGRRCLAIKTDVRNLEQMREFVKKCIAEFGYIDFVIANAGVVVSAALSDVSDEEWATVIDTNLTGVANTLRAVLAHLKERKSGRIVAISSMAGEAGIASVPAYAASKWGVIGLIKSVALEMGSFQVNVNAVCPTAVRTPMFLSDALMRAVRSDLGRKPSEDEVNTALKATHALPVGMLEPKAIADAILFLCSDEAKFISGMPLDVQAGSNARNVT